MKVISQHHLLPVCKKCIWLTVDEGGLEEVSKVREEETSVSMEEVPVKEVSVKGVSMERVAGKALVVGVEAALSEKQVKA